MSRLLVFLLSTLGASIGLIGMLGVGGAAWQSLPVLHPAPWLYAISLFGYGQMAVRWMGDSRMGPSRARFYARITVAALLAAPVGALLREGLHSGMAGAFLILELVSVCTLLMLYVHLLAFHAGNDQGAELPKLR